MSTSAVDDILRADPRTVALLAASDRATWQRLVEHIDRSGACPPGLVRALLAIDEPEGWPARIFRAFTGRNPDEGMGADWHFRRWFADGVVRHLPPEDPRALRTRHATLADHVETDATRRVRELVTDVERAGDSQPHRAVLGRTLLLLARRLGEDGDHDAAVAAAQRAEAVFAGLADATWRAQAVRMRGAALLRLRRIDEALAALDSVADAPSTSFSSEGSYRSGRAVLGSDGSYHAERVLDATDAVLDEAAKIAVWAQSDRPEWIRALGAIGERLGHRGCIARSEAGNGARERPPTGEPD